MLLCSNCQHWFVAQVSGGLHAKCQWIFEQCGVETVSKTQKPWTDCSSSCCGNISVTVQWWSKISHLSDGRNGTAYRDLRAQLLWTEGHDPHILRSAAGYGSVFWSQESKEEEKTCTGWAARASRGISIPGRGSLTREKVENSLHTNMNLCKISSLNFAENHDMCLVWGS